MNPCLLLTIILVPSAPRNSNFQIRKWTPKKKIGFCIGQLSHLLVESKFRVPLPPESMLSPE